MEISRQTSRTIDMKYNCPERVKIWIRKVQCTRVGFVRTKHRTICIPGYALKKRQRDQGIGSHNVLERWWCLSKSWLQLGGQRVASVIFPCVGYQIFLTP